MGLNIRVIAPDRIVLNETVEEIILPSSTGQLGILENHAPLLTALDIGVMRFRVVDKWVPVVIVGGFAEIDLNRVTILANSVEELDSIDAKTAETDLTACLDTFNAAETAKEKIDATQELRKARARFQAVTM